MPPFSCKECKVKSCLLSGKPCKEVEKILRGEGIKNSEWIRPLMPSTQRKEGSIYREIPFESNTLEEVAAIRAFQKKYGKNYLNKKGESD